MDNLHKQSVKGKNLLDGAPEVSISHLVKLREQELGGSPLYGFLVMLIAWALKEFSNMGDEYQSAFASDNVYQQSRTFIYHDIIVGLTSLDDAWTIPLTYRKAYMLHTRADADEPCYASGCQRYRKAKLRET